MKLYECFSDYNYAIISLDDVAVYGGVKAVSFRPFKSFREAVYFSRHLARQSIYYSAHDPFYNELLEKPCLHFAIVRCNFWGISVKDYYNIYFDVEGNFSSVWHNAWH